jgi:hypothetical protein
MSENTIMTNYDKDATCYKGVNWFTQNIMRMDSKRALER